MNPEHISGTTARNNSLTPVRKRAEDNDKFEAARSESVSFALGHIRDPMVSLFGRVKVAGDTTDSGPIERRLLQKVLKLHGNEWVQRWTKGLPKPHAGDTIRNLIRVALFEELYGPVCPGCYGNRWVKGTKEKRGRFFVVSKWFTFGHRVDSLKPCERCTGRGVSKWTDRDRAELMGMKYSTFKSTWARRIHTIKSYMSEYTEEIERVRL